MGTSVTASVLELKTDLQSVMTQLGTVDKKLDGMGGTVQQLGKAFTDAFSKTDGSLLSLSGTVGKLGGLLAGAFATTAIVAAGKQVLDYAGNISDLAARLQITTTAAQHWESAFGPAGVQLETVAKSANKLSENLAGNNKSALAALKALGVSVADLKKLSPEEQFNTVADAVGRLTDQGERVLAAKSLFGKGGVEMLSALDGHLQENIKHFDELGLTIDEETIKAADDFGDQLGLMGKQLMGIVATLIGPLLPALSALGNALMWIGRNVIGPVLNVAVKSAMTLLAGFWEVIAGLLARLAGLAAKLPGVGGQFQALSSWLQESSTSASHYMTKLWKTVDDGGSASEKAKPKIVGVGDAIEAAGGKSDKAAEALKKLREKLHDVEQHGVSSQAAFSAMAAELTKVGRTDGELERVRQHLSDIGDDMKAFIDTIKTFGGEYKIKVRLGLEGFEARDMLPNLLDAGVFQQFLTKLPGQQVGIESGSKFLKGFAAGIADAPRLLIDAFTGGGGLMGAFQAIGTNITDKLFGAEGVFSKGMAKLTSGISNVLSKGLGSTLGKVLGDSIGALIPGLGGLVAPLIGKLGGLIKRAFGGPSEAELQGRQVAEGFMNQFSSFDEMMARVGDAFMANGKTAEEAQAAVKAMLDSTTQGAEATAAAVAKITAELQRQSELEAVADQFGPTTDDLKKKAEDLAAALEMMKSKTGQYSREQIDAAAQAAADAYYAWQKQMADAGDAAAAAWIAAHDAAQAGESAASATSAALQELQNQLKDVEASYANEAPEEHMGVVEKAAREQADVIRQQIEDMQRQAEEAARAAADAAQQTTDQAAGAAEDASGSIEDSFRGLPGEAQTARGAIDDIFDGMHYRVDIDYPGLPSPPPVIPMADGGIGRATGPTLFFTRGNEDFAFSGEGKSFAGAGSGVRIDNLNVAVYAAPGDDEEALSHKIVSALRTKSHLYDAVTTVAARAVPR